MNERFAYICFVFFQYIMVFTGSGIRGSNMKKWSYRNHKDVTFQLHLMLHTSTKVQNCTSCQMFTHFNSTLIIHYTYIELHSMQREGERRKKQ